MKTRSPSSSQIVQASAMKKSAGTDLFSSGTTAGKPLSSMSTCQWSEPRFNFGFEIGSQLFWSIPKFEELKNDEQRLYHNDKDIYNSIAPPPTGRMIYHADLIRSQVWYIKQSNHIHFEIYHTTYSLASCSPWHPFCLVYQFKESAHEPLSIRPTWGRAYGTHAFLGCTPVASWLGNCFRIGNFTNQLHSCKLHGITYSRRTSCPTVDKHSFVCWDILDNLNNDYQLLFKYRVGFPYRGEQVH